MRLTDAQRDPRGVEKAVDPSPTEVAARDENERIELNNGHPWYVVQVRRVRERVSNEERGRRVMHQQQRGRSHDRRLNGDCERRDLESIDCRSHR